MRYVKLDDVVELLNRDGALMLGGSIPVSLSGYYLCEECGNSVDECVCYHNSLLHELHSLEFQEVIDGE